MAVNCCVEPFDSVVLAGVTIMELRVLAAPPVIDTLVVPFLSLKVAVTTAVPLALPETNPALGPSLLPTMAVAKLEELQLATLVMS